MPNQTWQSDFTHYPLTDTITFPKGVEVITWLDDHSRYPCTSPRTTAHHRINGPIVLASFRQAAGQHGYQHGYPASVLTDNGMVYTTRFSGGRGGRNGLESELRRLDIVQKNTRPNHPTTNRKVERFQQTMKKWLTAHSPQPATIAELQALIDAFVEEYNHRRPHRSLPHRSTPATAYTARPKATPSTDRSTDVHYRVLHDSVDKDGKLSLRLAGRMHHIGIGAEHRRPPSSRSSTTSTSASSTPPPANSSANSPSTPPATTSHWGDRPPPSPPNTEDRTPVRGPACP
jgi:hypothetical protein